MFFMELLLAVTSLLLSLSATWPLWCLFILFWLQMDRHRNVVFTASHLEFIFFLCEGCALCSEMLHHAAVGGGSGGDASACFVLMDSAIAAAVVEFPFMLS